MRINILGFKFKYNKKSKYGMFGDYKTWQEAMKHCGAGYAGDDIIKNVLSSTIQLKKNNGKIKDHKYDFDKIKYCYNLVICLFKIGIECGNKLNILDFGGDLGSHYFRLKNILDPIKIEKWTVVEQEHFVKTGKEHLEDAILNFSYSIDDVAGANVLILSGVIQYFENPYEWLEKFINKGVKYILFDRTCFNNTKRNRLTIQKVPKEIYDLSYPCWFLNEPEFLKMFEGKYELVNDFDDILDKANNIPSYYKGFLFKKIQNN